MVRNRSRARSPVSILGAPRASDELECRIDSHGEDQDLHRGTPSVLYPVPEVHVDSGFLVATARSPSRLDGCRHIVGPENLDPFAAPPTRCRQCPGSRSATSAPHERPGRTFVTPGGRADGPAL